MKFKKYQEIENARNKKYIEFLDRNLKALNLDMDIRCIALNKIDGANFSFIVDVDTDKIYMASRSQIVKEDENFYNCWNILETIRDNLISLKTDVINLLKDRNLDLDSIQFVGEICGGSYTHPDVKKVPGAQSVQGRINYHPNNIMIFYDICIHQKDGKSFYLDKTVVMDLFLKRGFHIPDVLAKGKLSDLIEMQFDSMPDPTYKQFGLPEVENNFAEGVVITPLTEIVFNNGERLIIKSKSTVFSEKRRTSTKVEINLEDFSDEFKSVYSNIFDYVTESRYFSVISKMSPDDIDIKNFGQISKPFFEDVVKDYNKENEVSFDSLIKSEQKFISKELNRKISEIIREKLEY